MSLLKFQKFFKKSRKLSVIGMIHLKSLPGTPKSCDSVNEIVEMALAETESYKSANIDGVLIENMADLPYIQSKEMGPEIVASMTRISTEVRSFLPGNIPCGIQILAGGNKEALAVAKASDLQFVRCEGYVFSHVADEGWMDGCAGSLLRYRRAIGCEDVLVFADLKKKHSAHAVTSDVSLQDTAKAAEFFLADGVILTGSSTGVEANPEELKDVREVTNMPILIGSGMTSENLPNFRSADALIVGSYFKKHGRWDGELDTDKTKKFMEEVQKINED